MNHLDVLPHRNNCLDPAIRFLDIAKRFKHHHLRLGLGRDDW
jgi:hypothetical protein